MKAERDSLFYPGLLGAVRTAFNKIKEVKSIVSKFSISDCLMSGIALFGTKEPSLLQFDEDTHKDTPIRHNIHVLYGVEKIPCDTYLRERLDKVDPNKCQKGLNAVIRALQRGKALETFGSYLSPNEYLLAIDGTGYFSSSKIHCENCCEKHHRDGQITYHHQALAAVMVNPVFKEVFPCALEPIMKQDGVKKNDCERNAAKRLIATIKASHPHFKFRIIGDGLYGNGPFIKELQNAGMGYIITATEPDHQYLFDAYKHSTTYELEQIAGDTNRHYKWAYKLPLNDSNNDLWVNLIEYWEYKQGKLKLHCCWITDFCVTNNNVVQVVKAGRSRWKIENETFNTLKNQGYHFEHNFGHGYKNLTSVFAYLMFIAFAIDQAQQLTSKLFQAALKVRKRKCNLWKIIRAAFITLYLENWEALFHLIINEHSLISLEERAMLIKDL